MNREWKPGDVALIEAGCHANRKVAIRTGIPSNMGWAYSDTHNGQSTRNWTADTNSTVTVVRPLALIDPENADDVAKLVRLFWAHGTDDCDDPHAMQAALREYANPTPQIEEPTGLGAVVEDARGVRWVRTEPKNGMTNPWQATLHKAEPDKVRSLPWAEVGAVRKLSEGVTE